MIDGLGVFIGRDLLLGVTFYCSDGFLGLCMSIPSARRLISQGG